MGAESMWKGAIGETQDDISFISNNAYTKSINLRSMKNGYKISKY